MSPSHDDRRDGDDRRVPDTVSALVIRLHEQTREEFIGSHARIRDDIHILSEDLQRVRTEMAAWRGVLDVRIGLAETQLTIIKTERNMEEKQHAKQATLISILVAAAVNSLLAIARGLVGKP